MKAYVVDQAGHREGMHITEMERPEPKSGDVLVRIQAVGLNPVDYKSADWGHVAWSYPHILGVDGAGVVEKVGSDVKGFKAGDRVYGLFDLTRHGTFAEYAIGKAHTLAMMPGKLSFEEAAAIPCAGWTAYQAFHRRFHLKPGQKVLIHAGSGGVGSYAIQLARRQSLQVLTTCSHENVPYVRDLGADFVIDYRTEDIFERVMNYTDGKGVHAILDTIGGPLVDDNFKLLTFGGTYLGLVDVPDTSTAPMFEKALNVGMLFLGGAFTMGSLEDQNDLAVMGAEMNRLIEDKKISSTLTEVLPFEKIPEGLDRLATHRVRGKLVARVSEHLP
ncbi:zinc-binding dehydrogenase [Bdellovibrio sp. HCB337]|uniref:zinc-binding dehydrogenase n=1 Tax=Bdellovibrio sp. HCB337 TaxID=3394358 RepID=UPI0039A5E1A0